MNKYTDSLDSERINLEKVFSEIFNETEVIFTKPNKSEIIIKEYDIISISGIYHIKPQQRIRIFGKAHIFVNYNEEIFFMRPYNGNPYIGLDIIGKVWFFTQKKTKISPEIIRFQIGLNKDRHKEKNITEALVKYFEQVHLFNEEHRRLSK